MSNSKIDALDRSVLAAIEMDAELGAEKVSQRLKVPVHTVYSRIKKLHKLGIVVEVPFINGAKLGISEYCVLFSMTSAAKRSRNQILSELAELNPLTWLCELAGDYQYGAVFTARHVFQVRDLLANLSHRFGNVFFEKSVAVRESFTRYSRNHLLTDRSQQPSRGARELTFGRAHSVESLVESDHHILQALMFNAQKSRRDIAKSLDIAVSTLEYRIQHMKEHGIIERFVYRVDWQALGLSYYKCLIHTHGLRKDFATRIQEFCRKNDRVVNLIECFGSWDFEIGIEVSSYEQVRGFLDNLYDTFPEDITATNLLQILKQHKVTHYPFRS